MGEFGKCIRDPLGGRSFHVKLAIQQSAADLVDQGESVITRCGPFPVEAVDHRRQIQPAGPGADAGDVPDEFAHRRGGGEVPPDQVGLPDANA